MKHFLSIILSFFAVLTLFSERTALAQDSDALIDIIEKSNSSAKARTGNFTEVRKPAGKPEQSLKGVLTYDPKGTLSMEYSSPEGDYFIIASNSMSMKRDGVANQFDLSKNRPMKSLADMLFSSFNGTLRALAASSASKLKAEKQKDIIVATMEATKKAVKGYSKLVLEYDSKTLKLIRMSLEEFDGSVTSYAMK